MPSISVQISEDDEAEIEAVTELLGEQKSAVIRKALSEGLSSIQTRVAIERYQTGEISVNQAARIADVSLAVWLDISRERNLTTQLSPEAIESDSLAAREL